MNVAFYGDGDPRSPQGGPGPRPDPCSAARQPCRAAVSPPSDSIPPESSRALSPRPRPDAAWSPLVAPAGGQALSSAMAGLGSRVQPSEFTCRTLCRGLLTNSVCLGGLAEGHGHPAALRCGWGPGQGTWASALSSPSQGFLLSWPEWALSGQQPEGPSHETAWCCPQLVPPPLPPPSCVQGLRAHSALQASAAPPVWRTQEWGRAVLSTRATGLRPGSGEKMGPCKPCLEPGAPSSLQPSSAPGGRYSAHHS